MKSNNQKFLLVDEIAKELRISRMTVYRYIKSGRLKAHKFGKEFRISDSDYSEFLEASKTS